MLREITLAMNFIDKILSTFLSANMREFEKMRSGLTYDYRDKEIYASLTHAKKLCAKLSCMSIVDDNYRKVIEELIPNIPKDSTICPPFFCDHGSGIKVGRNVFINFNCIMLDGGQITIGDNCLIGPNCQLYTPEHPKDYIARRGPIESARPITIGQDTWLCGGVIICPGVTIGCRCIIAAGSVVIDDVPDDSLVAGNPARIKKRLK